MTRPATKALGVILAFREKLARLGRDESGASAIEYALIVGLIAAVLVGTLTTLGVDIEALFTDVAEKIPADGGK